MANQRITLEVVQNMGAGHHRIAIKCKRYLIILVILIFCIYDKSTHSFF